VNHTHDFIVTNYGSDFYELMFSTTEGIFFGTLKTIMRGNNFTFTFDEEERYFEDETITAMLEIQPSMFAMAVAGSNYLQILDRDKQTVV
jgi:hypothetical protein